MAYAKPQKKEARRKQQAQRERERDQIKFMDISFGRWQVVRLSDHFLETCKCVEIDQRDLNYILYYSFFPFYTLNIVSCCMPVKYKLPFQRDLHL